MSKKLCRYPWPNSGRPIVRENFKTLLPYVTPSCPPLMFRFITPSVVFEHQVWFFRITRSKTREWFFLTPCVVFLHHPWFFNTIRYFSTLSVVFLHHLWFFRIIPKKWAYKIAIPKKNADFEAYFLYFFWHPWFFCIIRDFLAPSVVFLHHLFFFCITCSFSVPTVIFQHPLWFSNTTCVFSTSSDPKPEMIFL